MRLAKSFTGCWRRMAGQFCGLDWSRRYGRRPQFEAETSLDPTFRLEHAAFRKKPHVKTQPRQLVWALLGERSIPRSCSLDDPHRLRERPRVDTRRLNAGMRKVLVKHRHPVSSVDPGVAIRKGFFRTDCKAHDRMRRRLLRNAACAAAIIIEFIRTAVQRARSRVDQGDGRTVLIHATSRELDPFPQFAAINPGHGKNLAPGGKLHQRRRAARAWTYRAAVDQLHPVNDAPLGIDDAEVELNDVRRTRIKQWHDHIREIRR